MPGFYTAFEHNGQTVCAHVNGDPDMSETTLRALHALMRAAYDAAMNGTLPDETRDAEPPRMAPVDGGRNRRGCRPLPRRVVRRRKRRL